MTMNEAETRAEHIDPALAAAGWGVVEGSRIRREYPITLGRLEGAGKRGKPLTADYVLEYRNTKLAVVEAKAWDKALTEGVAQAKDYAGKLALRFTYASNGQGIYGIDMQTAVEGEIPAFPSPDELWKRTFAHQERLARSLCLCAVRGQGGLLSGTLLSGHRHRAVLAAIAAGQERILLTLATGTGKTFIAFQIAWKLFQSRWNLNDWEEGEPSRATAHPVPGRPQHSGQPGLQRLFRLRRQGAGAH
jgi:type I restriction enzyme R subunit